jgi:hypothetical protein
VSRTLKRPMFRRGGSANDGIMTGIVDREEKKIGDVAGRARELTPELEALLREFTPKTKLPLGQVGFALASGVDPLEALGAGYSQFVKRDDAREAAIRGGAAKLGIGQAMAEAKPSTSVLKNRKAAIINIKADAQKFPDGPTEENIIKETARLNRLDETGKGISTQRLIADREKELRTDEYLDFNTAKRQANFEYNISPKIQEQTDKEVQGIIKIKDGKYVTKNKSPGIYYDRKNNVLVEITPELEVIANPPELADFL